MRIGEKLKAVLKAKSLLPKQATLWASHHFPGPQQEVAALVARILVGNLGITFDMLKPTSRFLEDLAMDEIEPLELVLALEAELKFKLSDEEVARLKTVMDLVNYLDAKIQVRLSVPVVKVL